MSGIPEFNNKKLPPLEDIAKELHTIKHELFKGLMNDFKGFTQEYERSRHERLEDRKLLVKIHEATLEGQHDKRITKLEAFCENNANLKEAINRDASRISVLESKASDTDEFKISVKTTIQIVKYVGIGQLLAFLTAAIKYIQG